MSVVSHLVLVGDLDGDGIEDLSMGWSGEVNGIYNEDYTSILWGHL